MCSSEAAEDGFDEEKKTMFERKKMRLRALGVNRRKQLKDYKRYENTCSNIRFGRQCSGLNSSGSGPETRLGQYSFGFH